jgi:hypothetical protein
MLQPQDLNLESSTTRAADDNEIQSIVRLITQMDGSDLVDF